MSTFTPAFHPLQLTSHSWPYSPAVCSTGCGITDSSSTQTSLHCRCFVWHSATPCQTGWPTHVAVAGSDIKMSDHLKVLGVTLDSSMTFDTQVTATVRDCNFHLQSLRQLSGSLSHDVAQSVACAIIGSRLDYCNSLYYDMLKTNVQRLQRVQNAAARIVCQAPRRQHHSADLLKDLHWLPVRGRVDYKIAVLCYKAVKLQQPSYLTGLLSSYRQSCVLRSSTSDLLSTQSSSTNIADCRFSCCAGPPHGTVFPHLYALLTVSLVLGLSSRLTCSQDICSRSAVCASDTLTRSFTRHKFVTYSLACCMIWLAYYHRLVAALRPDFHVHCQLHVTNTCNWILSGQCSILHGTENEITCSVCVCVFVHTRTGFGAEYLEICWRARFSSNGTSVGNDIWQIEWSCNQWCHLTLAPLENGCRYRLGYTRAVSTYRKWHLWYLMVTWLVTSRDRIGPGISMLWLDIHAQLWLHVTINVKVIRIYLDRNVLKSVTDSVGQTVCSMNIILLLWQTLTNFYLTELIT